MSAEARLQRLWYGPAWRSLPLWPLAWAFRVLVSLKSLAYRVGVLRAHAVDVPVIVVGNLTVGGTGKTPVAAWLSRQLTARGHRVGVVLRGYGGGHRGAPRVVSASDDPAVVGDEAVLHARRGSHVVVIGADRVAAAERAIAHGAEVVVSDDGLQHLRLARDYEIAVVDAARGLGNRRMLPAGPLREPPGRLERVDAVVFTERGGAGQPGVQPRNPFVATARLRLGDAVNLRSGERRSLESFQGRAVRAVAAVGNPGAFFDGLRSAGLQVEAYPLPDHAGFDADALGLPEGATVLMTEKDAVKCQARARPDWWWVELETGFDRATALELLSLVLERTHLTGAGVRLG